MSKIVILGDTHFGCHNSSAIHHGYMKKFYDDFFKFIDENNIKHIVQLGDLFDVRKHINTWSLQFFRKNFLEPIIERNLDVWVLVGNHDIYYRESISVSSVEEILLPYDNWFHIVKDTGDYEIAGESFLFVPWVCKENDDDVAKALKASNSDYCAGHFEFDGFELFRGQMAKSHYKHSGYKKFKQVFSGHYHAMSSRDNVVYTGTPYELTWQDSGTVKGFFVLEDGVLTFQENPHKLYVTLTVDSETTIEADHVTDKILKVKLAGPWEPKEREALIDNLYSMKPHDIKIVNGHALVENTEEVDSSKYQTYVGVDEMISDYVSNITVNEQLDKDRLKHVLLDILNDATSL